MQGGVISCSRSRETDGPPDRLECYKALPAFGCLIYKQVSGSPVLGVFASQFRIELVKGNCQTREYHSRTNDIFSKNATKQTTKLFFERRKHHLKQLG